MVQLQMLQPDPEPQPSQQRQPPPHTPQPPVQPPARLVAMDIETVKPFPAGEDWKDHRPLGIACVATAAQGTQNAWYSRNEDLSPADRMTREDVSSLIDHFQEITRQGVTIVTWNGLGFDWQVLAEESGRQQECRQLALQHVDMMYHFFCHKGFPLALSTACQGMAVGEKQEGVTGLAAPHMWAAGQRQEVIDYCVQDAVITMKLASACAERGRLYWTARSGRPNQLLLPQGWKTVQEATEIPPPNTSWMTDPIPRASLDSWLSPAGE